MNLTDIYTTYDEITALMRESIMRIVSIGNVVFFSYWFIFGIVILWVTFGWVYESIYLALCIIWLL
jgi:hypothetical protein